jgi:hypothetical protein
MLVQKIDLFLEAALFILCLQVCLQALLKARGYRRRFVRPALHALLAVGTAMAVASIAGYRVDVTTSLPSILLILPSAALIATLLYFSAEVAYREAWGGGRAGLADGRQRRLVLGCVDGLSADTWMESALGGPSHRTGPPSRSGWCARPASCPASHAVSELTSHGRFLPRRASPRPRGAANR